MRLSLLVLTALATTLVAQAPTITSPTLQRTRAVWFVQSDNPIGAEVGLLWEPLPWNDAAAKAWDGAPGTRLPLANEAWAALETFTELEFGKVSVKAGNYYAVLDKDKSGWRLGLLDPEKVRAAQRAPGIAKDEAFVAAIPLQVEAMLADAKEPLGAVWEPAKGGGTATLVLKFGPYMLRAEAKVRGSEGGSPIALPDPRGSSRALFYKGKGNPKGERTAFAVVDHGLVAWSDEVAQNAAALRASERWRLGKDWATTLDTNAPLLLGGKKLAPGSWHLTLGKTKDGWQLAVSSAAEDHKKKLDGFAASHVSPVLEVPMASAPLSPPADKLQITFASEGAATLLVIAFGPERLTLPIALGK